MWEWLRSLFGVWRRPEPEPLALPQRTNPEAMAVPVRATATVSELAPFRRAVHDGTKFPGGFGATDLLWTDYWTLRARSSQLFRRNLYARGFLRRLITNEINTGLHLEATPEESILGFEEGELNEWTDKTETRFELWGEDPLRCDYLERRTYGALQQEVRMESLVSGDVLIVMRQDPRTGLPRVHPISGSAVQTPARRPRRGNRIEHGVELDPAGRQVAYWVAQRDGRAKRLPAFGEKSGRRIAWLVYGTDKRLDDVRGEPILSLILQSVREIDRYRDSAQRKALVNSMVAMFIKKTEAKPGTTPITSGAVRKGTVSTRDTAGVDRTFNVAEHYPGVVFDELQHGEEPHAFSSQGTDEKFGEFERSIVSAIAWANEIPPEILWLAFSNNYSASQAAINEFKMYLNRVRTWFGDAFCSPVYVEWLLSETLNGRIDAPGLLAAWRDPRAYDVFGAWKRSGWSGHIKPSTDVFKQARGYRMLLQDGLITRDRAARELTGTKYSKNAKKLRRENEQLVDALAPIRPVEETETERSIERGQTEENEEEVA